MPEIKLALATRLSAAVLLVAGLVAESADERIPIESLLNRYEQGEYVTVAQVLERIDDGRVLDDLDKALRDKGKHWIEANDPSEQRRRAFVAGAVAAEVTHALSKRARVPGAYTRPTALPEINRYILDRSIGPPESIDRLWMFASLSTWQDWGSTTISWFDRNSFGWALLLGDNRMGLSVPDILAGGGFLAEASRRFPSDGRLALARAEAREAVETRCSATFCHDEMTPATLNDLHKRASETPPDRPEFPYGLLRSIHETAVANLTAFERLVPTAAAFAAVASAHPDVRAEANVHIGYLAIRGARPDAALAPLALAVNSEDSYVRYLAEHLTGRALEALGRHSEAISAYRRALAIVPNAPTTTTLLAGQLFLSDEMAVREEANVVLRRSMVANPRPEEPWRMYWYGDARLWQANIEHLREALRQ